MFNARTIKSAQSRSVSHESTPRSTWGCESDYLTAVAAGCGGECEAYSTDGCYRCCYSNDENFTLSDWNGMIVGCGDTYCEIPYGTYEPGWCATFPADGNNYTTASGDTVTKTLRAYDYPNEHNSTWICEIEYIYTNWTTERALDIEGGRENCYGFRYVTACIDPASNGWCPDVEPTACGPWVVDYVIQPNNASRTESSSAQEIARSVFLPWLVVLAMAAHACGWSAGCY